MAHGTTLRSPYDNRVQLVQDTLTTYSALDHDAAGKLAVQVLLSGLFPREGALNDVHRYFSPAERIGA